MVFLKLFLVVEVKNATLEKEKKKIKDPTTE